MKNILNRFVCLSMLLICLFCAASQVRHLNLKTSAASLIPADATTQAKVNEAYGKLPLSFEINRGQADSEVKFLSRGGAYGLFLSDNKATLRLQSGKAGEKSATVSLNLIGANALPQVEGVDPLPGKSNYLIGNDSSKWRTGIANFAKVRYREIYRGIDLVYYGNQQQLEYDFVVKPGADPKVIKLSFDGAEQLRIDRNGDLVLGTPGGEVRQSKPVIYQEVNGERRGVNGRYTIQDQTVGFKIANYDRSRPLVIDPVIVYSTFLGGKGRETARGIAVDTAGNVYVTGETFSADFPVSGTLQNGDPGQLGQASTHAFVSKLNAAGTALVYSTYLGGAGQDTTADIAVDAAGNAYIAGTTQSSDFPLVNAAQVFRGANFFTSADNGVNWRTGGTLAGIVALAIDPINSATIYAGTASGLYKSANSGGSWSRSGTGLPDQRAVTALLVDPKNPSTLYAGTSSTVYFDQGSANRGTDGMIFKSTDGGSVWNRISAPLTIERVNAFALDPTNSAIIYVAASNGGMFKSTDGGANWNVINNGFAAGGNPPTLFNATSIAIDSSNPSRIFALVNGGLYRSANGGATWALNLMGVAPRVLAMDPRNPLTIYAGTTGHTSRSLFKTTDGGETWKAVGTGLTIDKPPFPQPDLYLSITALAVDPINPSILYAGVEELGDRFYKVYKSMDGGESWSPSRKGLADANVQLLAIDPQTPARLYAGFRVKTDKVAFAAKINPSGSALIYSTYVCYGEGKGIVVDASGAVYLAGMASFGSLAATPGAVQEANGGGRPASTLFVPPGATQPIYDVGHADAFVAKLNAEGSAFVYATYLGGNDNDKAVGLALDAAGNAYVTGSADSPDFPVTPNALQTDGATILGRKAWVAKLNSSGSALAYSTYLGTNSSGEAIAVDGQGNAYVTGAGALPARAGSFQTPPGPSDVFVAKLNANGSSLVYAARLGDGGSIESGTAIAVDASGAVTVAGHTDSTNFPVTSNATQSTAGGGVCGFYQFSPSQPRITINCRDAFVARLNPAGTSLIYSSYFGAGANNQDLGTGDEALLDLALDARGAVYLAGFTSSPNFPTTSNAFQPVSSNTTFLGNNDGFVAKLSLEGAGSSVASVSAANYRGSELAPESIVAAFGSRLALSTAPATAAPLPTSLAGTTVKIRDIAGAERLAPLFFVSEGQVNYQMPPGTALGNATVIIANGNNVITTGSVRIVDVAPGLFTADASGQGFPAALAQRLRNNTTVAYEPVARFDAQQNRFVSVPIDLGPEGDQVYLVLFGTGFRRRSALSAVSVKIGGADVTINYAGSQLQLIGLDQINALIPCSLARRGEVDVVVTVDGKAANTVRVSIK